eukprot:COSAG01_NODE_2298_length_7966_cov_53.072455_4_plen_47_part_00
MEENITLAIDNLESAEQLVCANSMLPLASLCAGFLHKYAGKQKRTA